MEFCTYLHFDGTCEEAFHHYARALGGKILMMLRYSDAPEGPAPSPESASRIMHARLEVDGRLLMGADTPPGRYRTPQGFCAQIGVTDPAQAERIFAALAEGGSIHMPIGETFWATRFGMLQDRFGVPWMINCEKPMQPSAGADDAGHQPFVISRSFDASLDTVWKAFTDPAEMQKWWGPRGVEIIHSKMDLRPGGTYHYGMKTPDGKLMWGRMVYREIKPKKQIVFVNSFSDEHGGLTRHPLAPSWPMELSSVFDFKREKGKTKFTVTWRPLNPTAEEQATFDKGHDSMKGGWTGTLDSLAAYLRNIQA